MQIRENLRKMHAALTDENFPWEMERSVPKLLDEISLIWDKKEVLKVLDDLIFLTKKEKAGFSTEVIKELVDLKAWILSKRTDWESQAESSEERNGSSEGEEERAPKNKWRDELGSFEDLRERATRTARGLPRLQQRKKMGEILAEEGVLQKNDLDKVVLNYYEKKEKGMSFGQMLVKKGLASEEEVTKAICLQEGVPLIDLSVFPVMRISDANLSMEIMRKSKVLPVADLDSVLVVATGNPLTFEDRSLLSMLSGKEVEVAWGSESLIEYLRERGGEPVVSARKEKGESRGTEGASDRVERSARPAGDLSQASKEFCMLMEKEGTPEGDEKSAPSRMLDIVLFDARRFSASDVHVEYGEKECLIRMRVDGMMMKYASYPSRLHESFVSKVKIMSGMDIAEKRRGQDGKTSVKWQEGEGEGESETELRVASFPVIGGAENLVLRLLASAKALPLTAVGFEKEDLRRIEQAIKSENGLILACGPTGSGKTTILHALLGSLNSGGAKIVTAEDPVEITQTGINQSQINAKAGWTFASALKTFLRADPDVIMIGELRDEETAKTAVEASMTGHLVLSTLHTNSAVEACARMRDLGANAFALSDGLRAVISSRLAGKFCLHCRDSRLMTSQEKERVAREMLAEEGSKNPGLKEIEEKERELSKRFGVLSVFWANGCQECNYTGIKGRVAVSEVLVPSEKVKRLLALNAGSEEIEHAVRESGFMSLKGNAMKKALRGELDLGWTRSLGQQA